MSIARSVCLMRFTMLGAAAVLAVHLYAGLAILPRCLAASQDVVVATVNNVSIMKSELDRVILEYKKKTGKTEMTEEEKQGVLKSLIRRQLILQQPSVQALKKDKAIVENVKQYEKSVIIARFLKDEVGSKLTVTEDDVEKYYKESRHKFSTPPKVEARHILLRTREEAEKVQQRLRKGEDFSTLAKECSIDLPMALEGGSMGTIEKGKTLPVLEKALFSMSVGEISDIVETTFGFHIITVDEIIPTGFASLEDVKDEIKKAIIRQKEAKAFSDMVAKLEKDAEIKIYEDRLKSTGH